MSLFSALAEDGASWIQRAIAMGKLFAKESDALDACKQMGKKAAGGGAGGQQDAPFTPMPDWSKYPGFHPITIPGEPGTPGGG